MQKLLLLHMISLPRSQHWAFLLINGCLCNYSGSNIKFRCLQSSSLSICFIIEPPKYLMFTSRSVLTSKVYTDHPKLMGSYKLVEGTNGIWRYRYQKEMKDHYIASLEAEDGAQTTGLWEFNDADGTHVKSRITALWPQTSLIFGELTSNSETEIMLVNAVKEGIY